MPDDSKTSPKARKAVGIYDRPASADFPKRAMWAVAIIAVLAFVAYWFLR